MLKRAAHRSTAASSADIHIVKQRFAPILYQTVFCIHEG